jgi:cytochrome c
VKAAAALLPLALAAVGCSSGGGGGGDPFRRCATCHTIAAGARNAVGPNLHDVFGRKAASAPGFNYSPAMRASGLTWDEATLDRFLANPQKAVPGTRMAFAGIADPAQRRQVIAYLKRSAGAH